MLNSDSVIFISNDTALFLIILRFLLLFINAIRMIIFTVIFIQLRCIN